MFTRISPTVALSDGKFFTNFQTVVTETHWKKIFLFNLNFYLILVILGYILHFVIGDVLMRSPTEQFKRICN